MWNRHKASIIVGVAIICLLAAFWYMPSFAFVFFLSVLLTLLLLDLVDKMALKLPRGLAAFLGLAGFLGLLLGLVAIVSSTFIPTLSEFTNELPRLASNIQNMHGWTESGIFKTGLNEAWAEASNFITDAIRSSLLIAFSVFNKFIDFIIIIFLSFYMLMDGDKIKKFVARLFPAKDVKRISLLIDRILLSLRLYVRSQLAICVLTGFIVYGYFTIMDLPFASVFAVASAISEFVPVLGPTVASCFGILMTAIYDPELAIQTAIFYLVMTQINHNVVYPAIVGRSLNLHPVAIILSIILGGELLGAAGMFLAVPFMVVIRHVIEDINEHSHLM